MLKHSVEYRTAWSERWNQDQCQNNDSDKFICTVFYNSAHLYTHKQNHDVTSYWSQILCYIYIKIYSMSMKIYSMTWNRVCIDMQWSTVYKLISKTESYLPCLCWIIFCKGRLVRRGSRDKHRSELHM